MMKRIPILILFGILLPSCENPNSISDYHNQKVKQFEEENKTVSSCEVCFIGDSITDGYDVKSFYPQWDVLNRGIGGDKTYNVLDILPISFYAVKPKVGVLLIGINDIGTGRSNSEIEETYENILKGIHENLPSCKMIVESVYPTSGNCAIWNDQVNELNPKIEALSEKYSYQYVDVHTPLLD
ncbi:MAG: hypothetical protein J5736_03625, partial [Bacilli bacterium]|nr:hypothetical protein [Bacilli bacterium]